MANSQPSPSNLYTSQLVETYWLTFIPKLLAMTVQSCRLSMGLSQLLFSPRNSTLLLNADTNMRSSSMHRFRYSYSSSKCSNWPRSRISTKFSLICIQNQLVSSSGSTLQVSSIWSSSMSFWSLKRVSGYWSMLRQKALTLELLSDQHLMQMPVPSSPSSSNSSGCCTISIMLSLDRQLSMPSVLFTGRLLSSSFSYSSSMSLSFIFLVFFLRCWFCWRSISFRMVSCSTRCSRSSFHCFSDCWQIRLAFTISTRVESPSTTLDLWVNTPGIFLPASFRRYILIYRRRAESVVGARFSSFRGEQGRGSVVFGRVVVCQDIYNNTYQRIAQGQKYWRWQGSLETRQPDNEHSMSLLRSGLNFYGAVFPGAIPQYSSVATQLAPAQSLLPALLQSTISRYNNQLINVCDHQEIRAHQVGLGGGARLERSRTESEQAAQGLPEKVHHRVRHVHLQNSVGARLGLRLQKRVPLRRADDGAGVRLRDGQRCAELEHLEEQEDGVVAAVRDHAAGLRVLAAHPVPEAQQEAVRHVQPGRGLLPGPQAQRGPAAVQCPPRPRGFLMPATTHTIQIQFMISFKHRNVVKRLQLTKNISEERLSRMLGQIFPVKGPVLGFKTESGQYYDTETFCRQKGKFYGEVVEVMEANDQLQISFTSDNLSTSLVQQGHRQPTVSEISNLGYVHQLKSIEKMVLSDPTSLTIVFILEDQKLVQRLNNLANRHQEVTMLYHVLQRGQRFAVALPLYMVYLGKKKVCEMPIQEKFEGRLETAILRWNQIEQKEEAATPVTPNNDFDDDCPSFVTVEKLSPCTVDEYLHQMANQMLISESELTKLLDQAETKFIEFSRIFCRGLVDNDYESFKQEVLVELHKHREAEERPISREEQRRVNLKKSVSDVELVTVDNYLEILNGLAQLILEDELHTIRNMLIEENPEVMGYFASYLAREYDRQTLANNLVITASSSKNIVRPVSRCVPRHHRTSKSETKKQESAKKEDSKHLDLNKLEEELAKMQQVPEFGQSRKPSALDSGAVNKPSRGQPESPCPSPDIQMANSAPPLLPPPAPPANFSPLKAMQQQSLQHSYHNAQKLMSKKTDFLSPQQCGLLMYLLKTCDASICQIVQQIQEDPEKSLEDIKRAMDTRLDNIFKAEFVSHEIEYILREKKIEGSAIYCYYENFRYEADLDVFLAELKKEVQKNPPKLLKKKSSLPSLKNIETLSAKAATNRSRMNSIDDDSFESKDSAMKQQQAKIQELDNFYATEYWAKQFHEMLNCTDFSQKTKSRLVSRFQSASPSIYLVIRDYIGSMQTNTGFNKNTAKIHMRKQDREVSCSRLAKYNMFKYITQALQNEGKITDTVNRWLRLNFVDENAAVISVFESYLVDKNEEDFLENLDLVMRMKNLRVEQTELDTFVNRLTFFLGQIYEHPNMLNYTVEKYNRAFKGICEIYHLNADSAQLFEDLDLLNSYCFEKRFAYELHKSFLNDEERRTIVQHFNTQVTELIEGVIDVFENGKEFEPYLMKYLQALKVESRRKKLSCIEEIRSESRLDFDGKARGLLIGLMEKCGRSDLREKLLAFGQNDPKLASLWQLHELTHSDEQLIQNLQILLLTPQQDDHTKRFIDKLHDQLTPFLKSRLSEKQPSLLRIIRRFSFGLPNDPQFQRSLSEYEKLELPNTVRGILLSVGLNETETEKALTHNFDTVEKAVKGYMEDKKEESLLEILQKVVNDGSEVEEIKGFDVKEVQASNAEQQKKEVKDDEDEMIEVKPIVLD